MKRNVLFIAYAYPPVGGTSLPGARRTVKFIKHLKYDEAHVLTVKPESYPEYMKTDNPMDLPVKEETIHRTGMLDIFKLAIRFKNILKRSGKPGENNADKEKPQVTQTKAEDAIWYEQQNVSLWQQVKDLISNSFYFPDDAAPWIIPAFIRGVGVIRKHKITVIFATGNPWSSLTTGYLLSKFTGVPYVADFRDPWIENPFHVSKGEILDKASNFLERQVVKNANLVSANTEELKQAFLRRFPDFPEEKFIELPNGYDKNDLPIKQPAENPKENVRKAVTLRLAHAGFLYGSRDPSTLLEAILIASREVERNMKIVFMQIGEISLNYNFREKFGDMIGAGQIELIAQLPYEECIKKLVASDVLVNIQPKTLTQVPSKLYDYLCLDRPILTITHLDGALGHLIKRYGFGEICDPDDLSGISRKIHKLCLEKKRIGYLSAKYSNKELFEISKIAEILSSTLERNGI